MRRSTMKEEWNDWIDRKFVELSDGLRELENVSPGWTITANRSNRDHDDSVQIVARHTRLDLSSYIRVDHLEVARVDAVIAQVRGWVSTAMEIDICIDCHALYYKASWEKHNRWHDAIDREIHQI